MATISLHPDAETIGYCGGCSQPLAKCAWCGHWADEHDAQGRCQHPVCVHSVTGTECRAELDPADALWMECERGYIETCRQTHWSPAEGVETCERCHPPEPEDDERWLS